MKKQSPKPPPASGPEPPTVPHDPAPHRLLPGHPAPDFTAQAVGGPYGTEPATITLSSLRGQPVVLYFYPKDDTPGCTTQACGLRDAWPALTSASHAAIFGVSTDPIPSHLKFIAKYNLPFPLLSDPDAAIAKAYDVWVEKRMYGKTYLGTERTTFIINKDGLIHAVFRKVKPAEHAALLQQTLSTL